MARLVVWLGAWGWTVWLSTRLQDARGPQIGIAVISLIPAVVWGFTSDTIFRHIPSSAALKWIVFLGIVGIVGFVDVGIWCLVNRTSGGVMAAAGGVLVLAYIGISEALTRIVSGFPTSVAGLVFGVLFLGGLGYLALQRD